MTFRVLAPAAALLLLGCAGAPAPYRLEAEAPLHVSPHAAIVLHLTRADDGAPVSGAVIENLHLAGMVPLHNAATQVLQAHTEEHPRVTEAPGGIYRLEAPVPRAGTWELRVALLPPGAPAPVESLVRVRAE